MTPDGTIRIFVEDLNLNDDVGAKRAYSRLIRIPKFLIVRTPEGDETSS